MFIGALILICATSGAQTYSESSAMFMTSETSASAIPADASDEAPNPYHSVPGWATPLPDGQVWGSVTGVAIDRGHIWVVQRCGGNSCVGKQDNPILEFDMDGKLLKGFGGGVFVMPHGLGLDKEGNLYVADNQAKDGKGQVVYKFSPEGKILMTLGTPGVAGSGDNQFNQPSDVAIAPNRDIFIADGRTVGADSNARIVKYSKEGKFIKAWGKHGTGPGEFQIPHCVRFDSKGRLYVADRDNSRIQVFDQDGNFITQYKQFGRPSGLFIDKDTIYAADSESTPKSNPGYPRGRGIVIGSLKTLKVTAFIPDADNDPNSAGTNGAEDVTTNGKGTVLAGEISQKRFMKYVTSK